MGHSDRYRHTAQGAETSGGGWWVSGAGDVQVGGAVIQESRWGAGANIGRDTIINGC